MGSIFDDTPGRYIGVIPLLAALIPYCGVKAASHGIRQVPRIPSAALPTGHEVSMPYFLGVDLGTTYTAAAIYRDGRTSTVDLGVRTAAIPSVVFLRDDETILTGEAASRRGVGDPGRVAREFKRRVGDTTPILLGGSPYSADGLMSQLLRWVVDAVTEREGERPAGVAVAFPANWGPYKQELLRQSISRADLDHVVTITEPEAAVDLLRLAGAGRAGLGDRRLRPRRRHVRRRRGAQDGRRVRAARDARGDRAARRRRLRRGGLRPRGVGARWRARTSSIRTTRRRWPPCSGCARSASRRRRRCRPTPRRRSRCCSRTCRPRCG